MKSRGAGIERQTGSFGERIGIDVFGARVVTWLENVRTSFWLLPTLMMVGAGFLSSGLLELEGTEIVDVALEAGWIYDGDAEGARQILTTIAGSMITIAGVVFSITVVVLTLASSQFGPRLLRTFLDDRGNQVVLGTFTATFLFCILGLRTVSGGGDNRDPAIPSLTVTTGVLLAIASLGILIYFIHHMASSIQAARVVDAVGNDLDRDIDRVFAEDASRSIPEPEGDDAASTLPEGFEDEAAPVPSRSTGYVQGIAVEDLVDNARKHGVVVRVLRRPGDHVAEGAPLAQVWPREAAGDDVLGAVDSDFALGPRRTPLQDPFFGLHQLTEIAVRALSPGVNDPYTAIQCVDRLKAALGRMGRKAPPSAVRVDEDGDLRVVLRELRFSDAVNVALDPIRVYGRDSPMVLCAVLEALRELGLQSLPEAYRAVLREQARRYGDEGTRLVAVHDREGVARAARDALVALAERDSL